MFVSFLGLLLRETDQKRVIYVNLKKNGENDHFCAPVHATGPWGIMQKGRKRSPRWNLWGWCKRRWHGKRWSSSKQRFVTSQWVFFVRRWAMARSKATDEYIPNLTPKKFFCMWITRKSEGEWRHRGDVGSAYTPQKTVLRHWEFCCSYRDKRWRVGKPMVSRTQIWPQKKISHPDLAITGVEVTSQPGLSYTTIPHLAVS